MKPVTTIKLHRCYICDALCGPAAGRHVRLRLVGTIGTQKAERVFLCHECIAGIDKAQGGTT